MKQMGQFNNPYQITYTDAAYLITRPAWLIRYGHQHSKILLDYQTLKREIYADFKGKIRANLTAKP